VPVEHLRTHRDAPRLRLRQPVHETGGYVRLSASWEKARSDDVPVANLPRPVLLYSGT
jgi:hypothetical protein